jgi:hypothetical protein
VRPGRPLRSPSDQLSFAEFGTTAGTPASGCSARRSSPRRRGRRSPRPTGPSAAQTAPTHRPRGNPDGRRLTTPAVHRPLRRACLAGSELGRARHLVHGRRSRLRCALNGSPLTRPLRLARVSRHWGALLGRAGVAGPGAGLPLLALGGRRGRVALLGDLPGGECQTGDDRRRPRPPWEVRETGYHDASPEDDGEEGANHVVCSSLARRCSRPPAATVDLGRLGAEGSGASIGSSSALWLWVPQVWRTLGRTPAPPSIPRPRTTTTPGGGGDEPKYVQGPIHVVGTDQFRLDGNSDGVACSLTGPLRCEKGPSSFLPRRWRLASGAKVLVDIQKGARSHAVGSPGLHQQRRFPK